MPATSTETALRAERAMALNAPLVTARLALEPLLAIHADALFAPLQDPAIYTWISSTPPESVASLRARWERLSTRLSPDGGAALLNWVVRRALDGALVGRVDADVDDLGVAHNIGYVFLPAYWGNGYATEAIRAVLAHLVASDVARVSATVTVGNVASCRVLERAGFARTRILRDNDTIRGVPCDDVEYVYEARPRRDA